MSKFLGYSWILDFYHPSILEDSERPEAWNARDLNQAHQTQNNPTRASLKSSRIWPFGGHVSCKTVYSPCEVTLHMVLGALGAPGENGRKTKGTGPSTQLPRILGKGDLSFLRCETSKQ